jgi:hypothetical protein
MDQAREGDEAVKKLKDAEKGASTVENGCGLSVFTNPVDCARVPFRTLGDLLGLARSLLRMLF